jgi:2-iminobutanoate/2-iminopropanoate deaminase
MAKVAVHHPEQGKSTGNYSEAVVCDGWVFVSGHASLDMNTGEVVSGTIEEETRRTLQHIERVLQAAGCTLDDVVKCSCHLADIRDYDGFDRTYGGFFAGVAPARCTVQSGLWGGLKVEIEAIARMPQKS